MSAGVPCDSKSGLWAWMEVDDEQASGPFETREAALEAASVELGEAGREIVVGTIEYLEPDEWVDAIDPNDVIERIEQHASENDWPETEGVVGLEGDDAAAARELHDALEAWSKKWLRTTHWRLTDEILWRTVTHAVPKTEEP